MYFKRDSFIYHSVSHSVICQSRHWYVQEMRKYFIIVRQLTPTIRKKKPIQFYQYIRIHLFPHYVILFVIHMFSLQHIFDGKREIELYKYKYMIFLPVSRNVVFKNEVIRCFFITLYVVKNNGQKRQRIGVIQE